MNTDKLGYLISQLNLFTAGVTLGIIVVENYLKNYPMVMVMAVVGLWNLYNYRNFNKKVKH